MLLNIVFESNIASRFRLSGRPCNEILNSEIVRIPSRCRDCKCEWLKSVNIASQWGISNCICCQQKRAVILCACFPIHCSLFSVVRWLIDKITWTLRFKSRAVSIVHGVCTQLTFAVTRTSSFWSVLSVFHCKSHQQCFLVQARGVLYRISNMLILPRLLS